MKRLPLVLLLLWLAACELPTALPPRARPFEPLAIYRDWWTMTERCSGLSGDFDAVEWYEIPASSIAVAPGGKRVDALWIGEGNRIVLTDAPEGRREGSLVRHEMLHALMRAGGHPRDLFIARCGGVVVCVRDCDEGPAHAPPADPAAVLVSPASLEVSVEVRVAPSTPPGSGTYVMMTVNAHNPSASPWLVQLPPSGDVGPPVSFSYELEEASGYKIWFDARAGTPEVTRFAPGEVKRFVFDFVVHRVPGETRFGIPPGTWTFRGSFGDTWAPSPPSLHLTP